MSSRATIPAFLWNAPPASWVDSETIDGELVTALLCEPPALEIRNGFLRREWTLRSCDLDTSLACYQLNLGKGAFDYDLQVNWTPQQLHDDKDYFAVQCEVTRGIKRSLFTKRLPPEEELKGLLPTLREVLEEIPQVTELRWLTPEEFNEWY